MPKEPLTLLESIKEIRANGNIPLCVLFWDAQKDKIGIRIFHDVTAEEARLLLRPFGLDFTLDEEKEHDQEERES